MRSILKAIIVAPAIALSAGCSKDKPADPALNNDLSLAAQANQNAKLDSISAAERTNAAAPATSLRSPEPAPARPKVTHTSSTTHRTPASSSSGSTASTSAPSQPATVVEKHTKRDAAIGAAAGAIIGASTSHDKVKGGIIGAAAGGILGGVIGNNVDKSTKKAP
jgi:uncharacterized protein YcfJ